MDILGLIQSLMGGIGDTFVQATHPNAKKMTNGKWQDFSVAPQPNKHPALGGGNWGDGPIGQQQAQPQQWQNRVPVGNQLTPQDIARLPQQQQVNARIYNQNPGDPRVMHLDPAIFGYQPDGQATQMPRIQGSYLNQSYLNSSYLNRQ